MAQTVAATLVGVFERIGVRQIFALTGNSLNPLAYAVRRSSAAPRKPSGDRHVSFR